MEAGGPRLTDLASIEVAQGHPHRHIHDSAGPTVTTVSSPGPRTPRLSAAGWRGGGAQEGSPWEDRPHGVPVAAGGFQRFCSRIYSAVLLSAQQGLVCHVQAFHVAQRQVPRRGPRQCPLHPFLTRLSAGRPPVFSPKWKTALPEPSLAEDVLGNKEGGREEKEKNNGEKGGEKSGQ